MSDIPYISIGCLQIVRNFCSIILIKYELRKFDFITFQILGWLFQKKNSYK